MTFRRQLIFVNALKAGNVGIFPVHLIMAVLIRYVIDRIRDLIVQFKLVIIINLLLLRIRYGTANSRNPGPIHRILKTEKIIIPIFKNRLEIGDIFI